MTARPVTRKSPAPATYLYALLRAPEPPDVGGWDDGVPGLGRPRAIPVGRRTWALVADAPLPAFGAERLEKRLRDLEWVSACAIGHQRVVERASGPGAILPATLFTLFHGDERVRAHVARGKARFDRLFRRVAGRREWGVRVTLDRRQAATEARRRAARAAVGASAGTAFLLKRGREREENRRLLQAGARAADRVFDELSPLAAESRRRALPRLEGAEALLLDAAFLVDEGGTARFRKSVAALGKRLRGEGLALTLTGPWPPYSFVSPAA